MTIPEKKKFESQLYQFAYIPKHDEEIANLAENLADKEDQWYFSDKSGGGYPILKLFRTLFP